MDRRRRRMLTEAALARVGDVNITELTPRRLRAIRDSLAREYRPATVNQTMTALRTELRKALDRGEIDAGTYLNLVEVPGRTEPEPTEPAALRALARVCRADRSPAGRRDEAMLALLASGLRRAGVVGLDVNDEVPESARAAVRRWLRTRGDAPGPLLVPLQYDRVTIRRLTPQAVRIVLWRRCDEAGRDRMSTRDLRGDWPN